MFALFPNCLACASPDVRSLLSVALSLAQVHPRALCARDVPREPVEYWLTLALSTSEALCRRRAGSAEVRRACHSRGILGGPLASHRPGEADVASKVLSGGSRRTFGIGSGQSLPGRGSRGPSTLLRWELCGVRPKATGRTATPEALSVGV